MKYLSIDLEATGLDHDSLIIEFAAIPFDSQHRQLNYALSFHRYLQCPSFQELKPKLSPWVIEHNQDLINTAHQQGKPLDQFKVEFEQYLASDSVRYYFQEEACTLFGKSLNAIDLPFLNRDLGPDFMRRFFIHRQLDLSSFVYALIDMGCLAPELVSGSELMKFLKMGEVAHTALADAINTVHMYFELLKRFSPNKEHPAP